MGENEESPKGLRNRRLTDSHLGRCPSRSRTVLWSEKRTPRRTGWQNLKRMWVLQTAGFGDHRAVRRAWRERDGIAAWPGRGLPKRERGPQPGERTEGETSCRGACGRKARHGGGQLKASGPRGIVSSQKSDLVRRAWADSLNFARRAESSCSSATAISSIDAHAGRLVGSITPTALPPAKSPGRVCPTETAADGRRLPIWYLSDTNFLGSIVPC